MKIYLSPPHMSASDRKLLLEAFDSNWIAPLGPHVNLFEKEMEAYLGIDKAVALSTGTAALHLALILAGVKEGDRVLCTNLTFAASANVILYEKAIPVFLDVHPLTWTLDPAALEKALKKYAPKALIAVDLYGQSADYEPIMDLCDRYQVTVIEDAAEALGANYKSKKCGTYGRMGTLSFNGNKIITTSGGGMLVSEDEKLIEKARFLATQARELEIHYEHKELGYNYRMSNLLAAVGRGQLSVLEKRVKARRAVFQRYYEALSGIEGIYFMEEAEFSRSNRWLTTFTVNPKITGVNRTKIIKALEKENIEARPVWKPMHLQPLYLGCEYVKAGEEDVSRRLFELGLCLPSGSSLSIEDQDRIIDIVLSVLNSHAHAKSQSREEKKKNIEKDVTPEISS